MSRQGRMQALGDHVALQEEPLVHEAGEHRRLRAALLAAAPRGRRRRGRVLAAAAGAAAAAALLSSAWLLRRPTEPPLRFFVGREHVLGSLGEFVAAAQSPVPIVFTDGTNVVFEPQARGRVLTTAARGADIVIESGRARVSVVPRPGNQWVVSSGPFVVSVTGTRFDVEWHPDRDAFALELYEGHVRVAGCAFADGHSVNPGERVEASCKEGAFRVSRIDGTPGAAAPAVPAAEPPADVAAPEAVRAVPEAPLAKQVPVTDDWRVLAEQGRFAEGYRLAASRFGDVCDRGAAVEVLLLGDAARLSGHAGEARRAYQRVRDRFAGTDAAALGAFQIGRLDFDQLTDYAGAERWLLTYLGERPSGTFASAAVGRLIEAEVHLGRLLRAQSFARQYLAQFPKGPHAETARRVLAAAPASP